MRHRLRFAAIALAAMSFAGLAAAEPIGPHWELTPFAGYTIFDGKLRFPGSNVPLTDNLHAGVRFAWESKSWYGLEAAAGFTPTSEDVPGGKDFDWSHASANFMMSPARGAGAVRSRSWAVAGHRPSRRRARASRTARSSSAAGSGSG